MEIPKHWRLKEQRYNLVGEIGEDGIPRFPPGRLLPKSNSQDNQLTPEIERRISEISFSSMEVSMSSK